MKKLLLFLYGILFCFVSQGQELDPNDTYLITYTDPVTQKIGLLTFFQGVPDTLTPANYDRAEYVGNDSIVMFKQGENWFGIYPSGRKINIPYKDYMTGGCFLVKKGNKPGVYSAAKNRFILEDMDSVAIESNLLQQGNDQFFLEAVKENTVYLANTAGRLIYKKGWDGLNNWIENYIVKNAVSKGKETLTGLKLKLLNGTEKTLLPAEYNSITYLSPELSIARKGREYIVFDGLFKPVSVVDRMPEALSDYNYFVHEKGKYGLLNYRGEKVIPCEFDTITYTEYLLTVKKNGKYGYYSWTGKELFSPTLDGDYISAGTLYFDYHAGGNLIMSIYSGNALLLCFNGGTGEKLDCSGYSAVYPFLKNGRVNLLKVKKQGLYGIIDWNGNTLAPFEYDTIGAYVLPKEVARFNGFYPVKKKGLYGFIGADFNTYIEPQFEEMEFSNGVTSQIRVKKSGKWALLSLPTSQVTTFVYDSISAQLKYMNRSTFEELTAYKNGEAFRIDEKGRRIYSRNELNFKKEENAYFLYHGETEKVLPDAFTEVKEMDGDIGFLVARKNGKYVVISETLELAGFYDDVATAVSDDIGIKVKKEGREGYINAHGREIIPCIYEKIDLYKLDFSSDGGGKAVKRNGKWGYLQAGTWKEIIPCTLDDIYIEYDFDDFGGGQFIGGLIRKKKGLFTQQGKEVLPCENEEIEMLGYDNIRFKKNGRYGIVNRNLKVVIRAEYDEVLYSENMVVPALLQVRKNGKYALFNSSTGKPLTDFIYDEIATADYCYYAKRNNKYTIVDSLGAELFSPAYSALGGMYISYFFAALDGKYGFIDAKQKTIIPFIYEDAKEASDSLFIVKKNGKYGVVDLDNKAVIPFEYAEINYTYLADRGIHFHVKKEKWGLIDKNNKVVVPIMFDEQKPSLLHDNNFLVWLNGKAGVFQENKGITVKPEYGSLVWLRTNEKKVLYEVYKKGRYGLITTDGAILREPDLESIGYFSEGLAAVKKDGKFGYMDQEGRIRIPFLYETATAFENGKAYVKKQKAGKGFEMLYIDKEGKIIE